ncbi:Uncharacterized protein APZ42_010813 [Daphnia magna]|uniref:Uncharacterized protein n=1 Tax=Daphnia magna TaxID=35525 RepID=A0A164D734_9CRUS|nr:Uncharacterized protein APZ42_010813 [Daphnia magna]
METFTGNAHPQVTITASNKEKSLMVHCLTALRRARALQLLHPIGQSSAPGPYSYKKKGEQMGGSQRVN